MHLVKSALHNGIVQETMKYVKGTHGLISTSISFQSDLPQKILKISDAGQSTIHPQSGLNSLGWGLALCVFTTLVRRF